MTKEDIYFDLTKNDDWFDIKLLIYCKKVCDIKQCIQDDTYQNTIKILFKKLNIFSTHFVHCGRGSGPIAIKINQMEPYYIKNIANWKPYTQYEFYVENIPTKIMKVVSGAS